MDSGTLAVSVDCFFFEMCWMRAVFFFKAFEIVFFLPNIELRNEAKHIESWLATWLVLELVYTVIQLVPDLNR